MPTDDGTDVATDDGTDGTGHDRVEAGRVDELYDLVDEYHLSGDVDRGIATELNVLFEEAAHALDTSDIAHACTALGTALAIVASTRDAGVSEPVADDLVRKTAALRSELDCG